MATQASIEAVQKMYIAYYGRPADLGGLNAWAEELDAANGDMSAIVEAFGTSAEATARFGGQSSAETITTLYQQLFGRAPESDDILNAWVDQLENNPAVTLQSIALDLLSGAQNDDAAAIANKLVVAQAFTAAMDTTEEQTAYAGDAAITAGTALLDTVSATTDTATVDVDAALAALVVTNPNPNPADGTTFTLTESTDRMDGTADGDTFEAYLAQNAFAGGVSNTLSSADKLDGMGGIDSLHAELVPEFFGASGDNQIDVQARTANIENVTFEARDAMIAGGSVTVDAKKMTDIDNIGSSFSDGDLVIENLTTLTSTGDARNTSEITVTMDHTDNFNSDNDASDLTVYFDEDYLLSGQSTSTSRANYWMLDEDSQDYTAAPLLNIERDGVTLTIDGTAVEIQMDTDTADAADTWEAFAAGLQARIDVMVSEGNTLLEGLSVVVDETNTDETFNDFGNLVVIPAITIIDAQGRDLVPTGFTSPADATGSFDIYGRFDNDAALVSNDPVSVGVELDKVGREGEGGDLIIGGKELDSDGGRDNEGEGIEVFNIDVLGDATKPSNLGMVSSTNGALETVNIATHAAFVSAASHASLTIRDGFDADTETVSAASFKGDLSLGTDNAVTDLDTLTATGGGDVEFYADITGSEKGTFRYNTGSGEDTVVVDLDGDAVDTIGTSFTTSTGSADDSVTLTMDAGVSQNTMVELDNLSISTGNGADTVNLDAYGNFNINSGDDSDFVRINSVDENGNATTGAWVFGDATGAQTFGDRVLYQAELTLTFAGFESTVAIETAVAGNFTANQLTINEAIEKAIQANPELSKLLSVTEGTGTQQITVESTVGGLNDLRVEITQPEVVEQNPTTGQVALTSTDMSALVQGVMATTTLDSDDLITAADVVAELGNTNFGGAQFDGNIGVNGVVGADYRAYDAGTSSDDTTGINFSTVNLGNGANDLAVFHSNDNSANVLEIDGVFGKASVVNFHHISPNDVTDAGEVGNHGIDFTSYLNNQIDPSATDNTLSATAVNVTLNIPAPVLANTTADNTDTTARANSVNMLSFDETNSTDSTAWSAISAQELVEALNGAAGAPTDFGGLTATSLSAATSTANLIGSTQKHIVMLENEQNAGEYKVFSLTSTVDADTGTTDGEFDTASAQMLGTLDFGASINFGLVGNSTWEAAVKTLVNVADGDDTVVQPDATYAVSASAATVDEGSSVTFTLNTAGVDAGTSVAYGLTGIDAADLVDGTQLSGNFVVDADGSTDITVALAADAATEGAETMTLSVAGKTASVTVNDTSLTDGGNNGGGTKVDTSADLGTSAAAAALDAGTGALNLTDDATVENNVVISNFSSDDQISVSNATAGDYSFTSNGTDMTITFNNTAAGIVNTIVLAGATGADQLVFDEASFEAAIGFDAFLLV